MISPFSPYALSELAMLLVLAMELVVSLGSKSGLILANKPGTCFLICRSLGNVVLTSLY